MPGQVFVMNKKAIFQTRSIAGAAVLLLATALICPSSNADEVTEEVLQEIGYEKFRDNPDEWGRLEKALATGQYVESHRFGNGPEIIVMWKKKQTAMGEGTGALELPEYIETVVIPAPEYDGIDGDSPSVLYAKVPVSAEHYAQIMREPVSNIGEPVSIADALDMYADGLILVSGAVDQEIAGSDFAGQGRNPNLWSPYKDPKKKGMRLACGVLLPDQGPDEEVAEQNISDFLNSGDEGSVEPLRRDVYESSRLGGVQHGFFSAQLFFFGPACMLKAVSDRLNTYEGDDVEGEVAKIIQTMDSGILGTAELESTVDVGSTPVSTWMIPNVDMTQVGEDGTKTTIRKTSISMDMENFVIVKNRSEGTIESGGQTREFYLESEMSDFRYVPDTVLFEPYRKVFRMGGMLDPAQRAQMQEAKAKLAEFEQQMASMPPSQRSMMEKMMGSKLEQFRKLADDGTFEMEMITTGFEINPHLNSTNASAALPFTQSNIVKIVQGHLVTLGYDPGKTNGELIKQTVIAITKFEAANGMPVTGRATVELVGALEASIGAQQ